MTEKRDIALISRETLADEGPCSRIIISRYAAESPEAMWQCDTNYVKLGRRKGSERRISAPNEE